MATIFISHRRSPQPDAASRRTSARTGPWASRFDSEESLVQAEDALRAAALRTHDLSPILPFESVYGPFMNCAGKATAIAIDPREPYGPDGQINYVRGDFLTLGLLYGVHRPADGTAAGGPVEEDDLWNTTVYPYPGGVLDPTAVPLAELGLDVPGVDRRFVHFPDQQELTAYLAQVYAYLFDGFDAMPLAP